MGLDMNIYRHTEKYKSMSNKISQLEEKLYKEYSEIINIYYEYNKNIVTKYTPTILPLIRAFDKSYKNKELLPLVKEIEDLRTNREKEYEEVLYWRKEGDLNKYFFEVHKKQNPEIVDIDEFNLSNTILNKEHFEYLLTRSECKYQID